MDEKLTEEQLQEQKQEIANDARKVRDEFRNLLQTAIDDLQHNGYLDEDN